MEIPQNLKEHFDRALDNELGLSFHEKHYNLVGMGTGYKRIKGQLTEIPAIILYVRQKGILRRGSGGLFPEKIYGFPVDVVEASAAIPCAKFKESNSEKGISTIYQPLYKDLFKPEKKSDELYNLLKKSEKNTDDYTKLRYLYL